MVSENDDSGGATDSGTSKTPTGVHTLGAPMHTVPTSTAPSVQPDDGNGGNGDGCTAACAVEPGFDCTGLRPTIWVRRCGDGVIALGEERCDDDNDADGDHKARVG